MNRAAAVIAVAVLGGCAETMLTQPADALQSVTNQIIKEQNMQEQTAPQKDALGVAIEIGKTTVIPFIQLLGKPQAENLLAEDRAQIAWVTNRLMSGKKGETPVVVIFPPDDPRVASISMQILAIQPNPPGTLASVRRGGMAEKTAKCEAYAKIGSLI